MDVINYSISWKNKNETVSIYQYQKMEKALEKVILNSQNEFVADLMTDFENKRINVSEYNADDVEELLDNVYREYKQFKDWSPGSRKEYDSYKRFLNDNLKDLTKALLLLNQENVFLTIKKI